MSARLLTVFLSGWLLAGLAFSATEESTEVLAAGETGVSYSKSKLSAAVRIRARKLQQGVSDSDDASLLLKDCPGDRAPCSLVEDVRIEVNETLLFVPRSTFRGLSNVRVAKLTLVGSAFHLVLRGGDGSEGYVATIIFDKSRVFGRRIASSLAPSDILEEISYRRQKDSFDR